MVVIIACNEVYFFYHISVFSMNWITTFFRNVSNHSMTTAENIINLKNLILIWYFIIIITILLTPALPNENRSDEVPTNINSADCNHNFTKYGKISLQFQQECDDYYINVDFKNKTSIINLNVSVQQSRDDTNLTESGNYPEGNFTIKINIYEPTVYDDGNKEDILQEKWDENQSNVPIQRNYLSWTSNIYVFISSTGNWSQYEITLSSDEIQHSLRIMDNDSDSGEIEDQYLPNSVMLYRLTAEPNKKWEGMEITIEELNINKEMGEYLLIGQGTDIFKSKDYLPLYVTEMKQNSTFYVGNSSAYVAFVSGPIQKTENRIKILWNREGKKILPKTKEDPLGVLNSSLICFYNYSAAIKEFEKKEDERFKSFRQNFTEAAKDFLKSHGKDKNIESLDETSVTLFGPPTKVKIDAINSNALSILVKVMYEGKSIFTWNDLQKIIAKFEKNETNLFQGHKVGKCPQEDVELPYKDNWSFLIYAMVPVFGLFALMMWAWKQNIFAQKCTPEKKEKLCPAPLVLAEPNPYETTIPKVCLYDGNCRRGTLIQGTSQPEAEGRDQEIAVELHTIPSTSRESDTLTRFLASRKSKHRPSIQSLVEGPQETSELSNIGKTVHEGNESEHLYDSVNSNKKIDETKL